MFSSRASETVIPEENPDDFWMAENNKRNLTNSNNSSAPTGSLSLPIQPHHQPTINGLRKGSPAAPVSYMERYSPCGSSPSENQVNTGGYMLMSPGAEIGRRYVQIDQDTFIFDLSTQFHVF